MGGKLFHLPRMPRAEYLLREAAVRRALDTLGVRYRIPRFYGDKVDFGDMDVIVLGTEWEATRDAIIGALGIRETKSVGRVFSTVYDGLQTDFFPVDERYVDSTADFMSFNDLGNLLGRICRRFELKWGENGLAYVFRRQDANRHVTDLPITQDFARVCAFLGLDHAAWVRGFPTLVALYEWVVTSPYFSVAPYLDDAGPMAKRSRDRPTIASFVEFLRHRGISARPDLGERGSHVALVAATFPEARLEERLAEARAAEARAIEIAAKWNGKLVMRLRDERGEALGNWMMRFKRSIAPTDAEFDAWVAMTPCDEIERRIISFG